jgi:predicted small lipoprotein YifL
MTARLERMRWLLVMAACAPALSGCGKSGGPELPDTAEASDEAPWPRGKPSAPPCSSATTRADCIAGTGEATCDPARWMREALGRLGSTEQVSCNDSEVRWLHLAGAASSEKELWSFVQRVREPLRAIPGLRSLGFGICCSDVPAARCITAYLDPCGTPLDEVVSRISELRQRDTAMKERELGVRVELTHPGPRCQADVATCSPLSFGAPADPDADRFPISVPHGDCAHDGECTFGGCISWREAAHQWVCQLTSSESVEPPNTPRACGCVARECRWFEQDGGTGPAPGALQEPSPEGR